MWGFLVPALGSILSGIAGAKSKNRQAEDQARLTRDELRLLANRDFRDAQNDAFANAMRSAHVLNWRPLAAPGGIPDVYAGRTASPDAMNAARAMQRRAMIELLNGRPLSIAAPRKPGFLENALGIAGLGMTALGSILGEREGSGGVEV